MKMQHVHTLRRTAGHGFLSFLGEGATQVLHAVSRWNERRKAVRYLHELSDYHLKDLGIRRSEILSVVYGETSDRRRGYQNGR
jgi:uncharacterized protein YjiS (DUF1127 family)